MEEVTRMNTCEDSHMNRVAKVKQVSGKPINTKQQDNKKSGHDKGSFRKK